MSEPSKKLRLAILLSGGGRTMLNLSEAIARNELCAEIAVVISSRLEVAGNDRARKLGFEPVIVQKAEYPSVEAFSQRLETILDNADVDLILQCGWLCYWKIPPHYRGKVMNIHPSLLPSFGGKGMFGHHVHEAVLKQGCKLSGVTVHFVTDAYDAGPIIVQRACPVMENDTADTLATRVFEQECLAYPEVIRLFAQNRLRIEHNRVRILSPKTIEN